jgi:hypothetical protein
MQKGWASFALLLLWTLPLFAQLSDERLSQLSQSRYWQILLHLKRGKSEIDDKRFLLTDQTDFSPKTELEATIRGLRDANQSFLCRYPARIAWLRSEAPSLFEGMDDTHCKKLEETLHKEHIRYVTLVFPTAYINSPASMFGHTFVRLDKEKNLPLVGEAVNYAAQTDESNGLVYMVKGLAGGYKGYFSVLPYYQKIKEYNAMEQRDMWEYRLRLSEPEIRRMLYHLYELQGIYGDYYFFTRNCSYNLLWLLDAAKGTTGFTDRFDYKAIPIDTIRVVQRAGLIDGVHYRPSRRKEMLAIARKIRDIPKARAFVKAYDPGVLKELNRREQARIADLAILYLKHARSQKDMDKKRYVSKLHRLLRYRSRLPKVPKPKVKPPVDPLEGHLSAKLALGVDSSGDLAMTLKPAMHDIYDPQRGFVRGAYIDFLTLKVARSGFQSLDFVSVTSLAATDRFFSPWSWRVRLAAERLWDEAIYMTAEGGVGKSVAVGNMLLFLLAEPKLCAGKNRRAAAVLHAGLLTERGRMTAGAWFKKSYYDNGDIVRNGELFATWRFSRRYACNLKLHEDKIAPERERRATLSLFYYF